MSHSRSPRTPRTSATESTPSPAACRAHVEQSFDAASMVGGYEAVYREVLVPLVPTWPDDVLVASPRRTRVTPAPAVA